MRTYDVIIIGAGSGNRIVDERFDDLSVAIVDEGPFGGTCVNRGCIPSKMFLHAAEIATQARSGPPLGVDTSFAQARWADLRDRVFSRLDEIATTGEQGRRESAGVDVLKGRARFTGERRLVVALEDGEVEVEGTQVVVAAGSRPSPPPIDGLDDVAHETSDTVMHLDSLPERIAVVGGGYVGTELAHVFAALGSHVVQLDPEDTLLSGQDAEVAEQLTRRVAERWDVRTGTQAVAVAQDGDGPITVRLDDDSSLEVDVLLVAAGRVPNTDLVDAEAGGLEVDDAGRIVVDEHQRAGDGVWALGDVCTHHPLKHVANHEAEVVQHNLLHPDDLRRSEHRFVPSAVFTQPQVAAVGQTEAAAREAGVDLAVGRATYGETAFGYALEADDRNGPATGDFVKVLADRSTGLLVGALLVGPHASMLVQPLVQAMALDVPAAGLADRQYWIHPAATEVVESALRDLDDDLARDRS